MLYFLPTSLEYFLRVVEVLSHGLQASFCPKECLTCNSHIVFFFFFFNLTWALKGRSSHKICKWKEFLLSATWCPGQHLYACLLICKYICHYSWAPQELLVVKSPPANVGDIKDVCLIHGSGKSPEGGHGNPLQYSCLENSKDKKAWQVTVCRFTKNWTLLERLRMHGWCYSYDGEIFF